VSPRPTRRGRGVALLASGLLGASAALLVACGSSSKLIPVANSEPLQKDFEEVARAAESGNGSCAGTEAALNKADHDFAGLPASVDAGLRRRLGEGLSTLRRDALEKCLQPVAPATTATSTPRATTTTPPTQTTTTTPPTTATTNTQSTPSTTTTTSPGGGTPAKEGEPEGEPGAGKPKEKAKLGEGGGDGAQGGGREAGK
jgi:hypothetical protein